MAVIQESVTDEVLDFLASRPTPQEILDFHASETIQVRVRYLLEANSNGTLTPEERSELDEFERIDDVVAMLKIRVRSQARLA